MKSNTSVAFEAFCEKILNLKPLVLDILVKRQNGFAEPQVVSGYGEILTQTAKNLVKLQLIKGDYEVKDMDPTDANRLHRFSKEWKISRKEVVDRIVRNNRYLDPEAKSATNLCNLIEDIKNVYDTYFAGYGFIPLNAISKSSIDYLCEVTRHLPIEDKLKFIMQTYLPEIAETPIKLRSYMAVTKNNYYVSNEEFKQIAKDIASKFADQNGNIDSIFAPENSSYLKGLLHKTRCNHLTFDSFVKTFTNLNYTKIYAANTVEATKLMVVAYYQRYGTYRGITSQDPYLETKVTNACEQEGIYTRAELFAHWGLDTDNDTFHRRDTQQDLLQKEQQLYTTLVQLFPDKVIPPNFSKEHKQTYEKVRTLGIRLGYKNVDTYLKHLMDGREVKVQKAPTIGGTIVLTESDINYYRFL